MKSTIPVEYYQELSTRIEFRGGTAYWTNPRFNAHIGRVAGSSRKDGYICIASRVNGKCKQLMAHKIRWFMEHGAIPEQIDHINGDKSDNNIENLRVAKDVENVRNSRKHRGASKYKGVSKNEYGWTANIQNGNERIYLLFSKSEVECAKAYDEAVRKYRPNCEFSLFNFPREGERGIFDRKGEDK